MAWPHLRLVRILYTLYLDDNLIPIFTLRVIHDLPPTALWLPCVPLAVFSIRPINFG
jgi:hypothetical protein